MSWDLFVLVGIIFIIGWFFLPEKISTKNKQGEGGNLKMSSQDKKISDPGRDKDKGVKLGIFDESQIIKDLIRLGNDEDGLSLYIRGFTTRFRADVVKKNMGKFIELVDIHTNAFNSLSEGERAAYRHENIRRELELENKRFELERKRVELEDRETEERLKKLKEKKQQLPPEQRWKKGREMHKLQVEQEIEAEIDEERIKFKKIRKLEEEKHQELNKLYKESGYDQLDEKRKKEVEEQAENIKRFYDQLIWKVRGG